MKDTNSFNDNWEFTPAKKEETFYTHGFDFKINDFEKNASYFCIFKVIDVFNNIGYSNLIKIK